LHNPRSTVFVKKGLKPVIDMFQPGMGKKGQVVTQADIAERAGVSRMTVSYALRGSGMVSIETRERILALAEEMGYRPNPLVSNLMRHLRAGTVREADASLALVLGGYNRAQLEGANSLTQLTDGIQSQAEQAGFRLEQFFLQENGLTASRLSEVLWNRGITGVIVLVARETQHLMNGFEFSHFALSTYGYALVDPVLHRAASFHLDVIRLAGTQMVKKGYRRLSLLLPTYMDERLHIFLGGYHSLSRGLPPGCALEPCVYDDPGEVLPWLQRESPDAVLTMDGRLRSDILTPDYSGPVPEVALLNHQGESDFCGVSQKNPAIGAALVDLVLGQLNRNERGVPEDPKTVLIKGTWVEKGKESI